MTELIGQAPGITSTAPYEGLESFCFTARDFDAVLDMPLIVPFIEVMKDGAPLYAAKYTRLSTTDAGRTTPGTIDKPRLLSWLDRGATLIANNLERSSLKVADACSLLERYEPGAEVTCIAFMSPRDNSAATGWHVDDFHGHIYQAEGKKSWSYGKADPRFDGKATGLPTPPAGVTQVCLAKGQWLNLPEGVPHYVVADQEPSLHLTFMIRRRKFYSAESERLADRETRQAMALATTFDSESGTVPRWADDTRFSFPGDDRVAVERGKERAVFKVIAASHHNPTDAGNYVLRNLGPHQIAQLAIRKLLVTDDKMLRGSK